MKYLTILLLVIIYSSLGCSQNNYNNQHKMTYKKLTPEEQRVIIHKGTEKPFTGKFYEFNEDGTYVCKQCGEALYSSVDKFDSHCGWPSFDNEIEGAVKRVPDADGQRTEIVCNNCGAHLGHVFFGEGYTPKNTRHCVNSISLDFKSEKEESTSVIETAIFAGGCFWGVEYFFQKEKGVLSTEVGYIGGHIKNPTYQLVCANKTGHAEAIKIIFDPAQTNYEKLAKLFFEIHDPTELNRQGLDVGNQYRSEIFYLTDQQKEITEQLIQQLKQNGYKVVTKVTKATKFWPAEDYHQEYYEHKGTKPYCHGYVKRF